MSLCFLIGFEISFICLDVVGKMPTETRGHERGKLHSPPVTPREETIQEENKEENSGEQYAK